MQRSAFDGDWFGRYTRPPRPVRLDGVAYRSALEARWRTCWTELGWAVTYEPRIFDLPDRKYLPDFALTWMSTHGTSTHPVEVKPRSLAARERRALLDLSKRERVMALAFCGNPWPGEYTITLTVPDRGSPRVRSIDGVLIDQDRGGDIFLVLPGEGTRLVGTGAPYALTRAFIHARQARLEPIDPLDADAPVAGQPRLPGVA